MAASSIYATYPSLHDRTVVVSGGATGIGASFVGDFAAQGAKVIFLDIQEQASVDLVKSLELQKPRHVPIFVQCDVTDVEGSIKPVAARILESFPNIHGLINNAANDTRQPTPDITLDQWDYGMAVNLRHVFFLTQALMPGLIESGSGSVINMGSISWAIPSTGLAPYVASKAAIVGLTKTLAHEFGPRGVRVNSIMPGAIATDRQRCEILTPEYQAVILDRQAIKRILQPSEVARLALWLVADDSAAMTNQSIVLDGGWV